MTKLYNYCLSIFKCVSGGHSIHMAIILMFIISISPPSNAKPFTGYSSISSDVDRKPDRQQNMECPIYTCGPTTVINLGIATPPAGMGLDGNIVRVKMDLCGK